MKQILLILFTLLFLFVMEGKSQQRFAARQAEIFDQSTKQWPCSELMQLNARHFTCGQSTNTWKIPQSGDFVLFGQKIEIPEAEQEIFKQIVFPDGRCDRYLALVSLCDLYFPLFSKKIEEKKLQADYRYLPLLLSGCNQHFEGEGDRSGLWAMDYLPARKYHLRIDTLVDERKGGDFTCEAASAYLTELSGKMHADPFRTIVAWRSGVPYVNTLPEFEQSEEFILRLDEDNRSFIRFYAWMAALIKSSRCANQLNAYFDILGQYEAVPVRQPMRMEAVAAVLNQDMSALRKSNPVFTGAWLEAGYRRLPFVLDRVAALKFEAYADSIVRWQPPRPVVPEYEYRDEIVYHKVKRGETLSVIASKHHVTVAQIKKWNKLKGDKIRNGQKLRIEKQIKKPVEKPMVVPEPVIEHSEPVTNDTLTISRAVVLEQKIDAARKSQKAGKYNQAREQWKEVKALDPGNEEADKAIDEMAKLEEKNKPKPAPKPATDKITYTVKSGDNLWRIARKYGVSEKEIMKWNSCGEDIRPGQKLIIYRKK